MHQIDAVDTIETVGMIVKHKSFGEGMIILESEGRVVVEFSIGEKTFQSPMAFEKGFLIPEYENYLENAKQLQELQDKLSIIDNTIKEKEELLKKLVI